jgi:hypothetical protein
VHHYTLTLINGGGPLCIIPRLKARCDEALAKFAFKLQLAPLHHGLRAPAGLVPAVHARHHGAAPRAVPRHLHAGTTEPTTSPSYLNLAFRSWCTTKCVKVLLKLI